MNSYIKKNIVFVILVFFVILENVYSQGTEKKPLRAIHFSYLSNYSYRFIRAKEHLTASQIDFLQNNEIGRFGSQAEVIIERAFLNRLEFKYGLCYTELGYIVRPTSQTATARIYTTFLTPFEVSLSRKIWGIGVNLSVTRVWIDRPKFTLGTGIGLTPTFVKNKSVYYFRIYTYFWEEAKDEETTQVFSNSLVLFANGDINARLQFKKCFVGVKGMFLINVIPIKGEKFGFWIIDEKKEINRYLFNIGTGIELGIKF